MQTPISLEPTEWMLRVVGSDIHLFGDGLLGEFPCVREAYDQSGSVSFQLLRIKEQAREAMVNFHENLEPLIKNHEQSSYRAFGDFSQHFYCPRFKSGCVWYERQIWHKLSLVHKSYEKQEKIWLRICIAISPENFHFYKIFIKWPPKNSVWAYYYT